MCSLWTCSVRTIAVYEQGRRSALWALGMDNAMGLLSPSCWRGEEVGVMCEQLQADVAVLVAAVPSSATWGPLWFINLLKPDCRSRVPWTSSGVMGPSPLRPPLLSSSAPGEAKGVKMTGRRKTKLHDYLRPCLFRHHGGDYSGAFKASVVLGSDTGAKLKSHPATSQLAPSKP